MFRLKFSLHPTCHRILWKLVSALKFLLLLLLSVIHIKTRFHVYRLVDVEFLRPYSTYLDN